MNKYSKRFFLPYLGIDKGVVLLKDGSAMITIKLGFIDFYSVTEEERLLNMNVLNKALSDFGRDGLTIQMNEFRVRSADYIEQNYQIQNPVARLYDESRRQLITDEQYKSILYLSIIQENVVTEGEKALDDFKHNVDGFIRSMEAAGTTAEKLSTAGYKKFLFQCVGVSDFGGVSSDKEKSSQMTSHLPFFIDDLFDFDIKPSDTYVKLQDGRYAIQLAVTDMPATFSPYFFRLFFEQPLEMQICSRFKCMNFEQADKYIKKRTRYWTKSTNVSQIFKRQSSIEGDGDALEGNQEAANMYEDGLEAKKDLDVEEIGFGKSTFTITLIHADISVLRSCAQSITKNAPLKGLAVFLESINATESYLSTLPGNNRYNIRELFISTRVFSEILHPFMSFTGNTQCPNSKFMPGLPALTNFYGAGKSLYYFNLHNKDVGHSWFIGGTGSGKTTLLQIISAQWMRYPESKQVIIQKGKVLTPHIKALGGQVIDPLKKGFKFSLFDDVRDVAERNFLEHFIIRMLALREERYKKPDLITNSCIKDALNLVAESMKDDYKVDLKEFTSLIQDTLTRQTLEHYYDGIFDGETSAEEGSIDDFALFYENAGIVSLELSALLNFSEMSDLVLEYFFHKLTKMLKGDPTLIIYDEAQTARNSEVLQESLSDYLETIRNKNGALVFATLDLESLPEKLFNAMTIGVQNRVFMRANYDVAHSDRLQRLGYNDETITSIQNVSEKGEFLQCFPATSATVYATLTDVEKTLEPATPKDLDFIDKNLSDYRGLDFYEKYHEYKKR